MTDIFLSYVHTDRDRVTPVVRGLEAKGWGVWWDSQLVGGDSFREVIEEKLAAADCVVVVWSTNSVSSSWVLAEADEGFSRKVLVPIALDDVSIPWPYNQCHTVTLRHWSGEHTSPAFRKVVDGIAQILSGREGTQQRNRNDRRVERDRTFDRREANRRQRYKSGDWILTSAKKALRTGFTGNVDAPPRIRRDTRVETVYGEFIDHGDGTITDPENSLTWIRAPWGMTWDDHAFFGKPIYLSWNDAVYLFGRGDRICDEQTNVISAHLSKASKATGFRLGKCTVAFAGYEDWRLPTVNELWPFLYENRRDDESLEARVPLRIVFDGLPSTMDQPIRFWTANGRVKSNLAHKVGTLLVYCLALDREGGKGGLRAQLSDDDWIAWAFDANGDTFWDLAVWERYAILFVRDC